ncbi:MAG: formimidoylglutamate deiminase [Gammaproteobacteria bacterium RIFCSPHIGHO2_12_FULL_63_22]|nr:MAG: formimidoylglutamate deiminase [Gammaproteobacteria bacterium RIFCSPHIGHO2_12_FULL_63_22]
MDPLSLPGIPNIHSHSFQRAMAGMAERGSERADSFWTWRELMYRFAGRLTPESLHDISAQLFVEMLQAGYTSTCEFHYLHHQAGGQPYDDPAAMSQAIIAAARETGIRLTLLPVLYMTGGFDGRELSDRQRRFGHDVDAYLSLLDTLVAQEDPMLRVGVALHSLRAVPADAMRDVLAAPQVGALRPIHIHISEQTAEVEECIASRGARPVEWLLANAAVDDAWTLVHATHVQASELVGIASSKAVVALCPTTEANLGDGVFPLRDFIARGGRIGIGSDSNVSVSPVEELRWLEYGQRLVSRQRNIAATRELPSSGESLVMRAIAGGRQSNGHGLQEDDLLVLDEQSASMCGVSAMDLHDRFVFAGNGCPVKDVFVQGRRVIESGRHVHGERIRQRFRDSMRGLLSDS